MKRRRILVGAAACCGIGLARQGMAQGIDYSLPGRLLKPDAASDEGGLWAMVEREEKALRRNPLLIRDAELRAYVQEIVCRLGGEHCPDIRVYLVRTPLFNANMAPNGMMQVGTGLLLRMENEAQLAAILGHEIGHYLQRHSVEQLRDIKAKSAFGQFIGLFGLIGAVGQMAILASAFAYSREHEREADRIGAFLMHQAGYPAGEAARVWSNLLAEARARGEAPERSSPWFATHPPSPERYEALAQLAAGLPGGQAGERNYLAQVGRFMDDWLQDEIKRGQYAETLVLLDRMIERSGVGAGLLRFYRGETFRLRGESGDPERALTEYRASASAPEPPAGAFRGIGLIARRRGGSDEARRAFKRYLELAPQAADAALILNYLAELES